VIAWERRADVGIATLDRPERRNALNALGCDQLRAQLSENRDLRAVVIVGAGSKAFCAGADLGSGQSTREGGLEHGGGDAFRPAFEAVLDAIVDFPTPVIAAVNGAAIGAGMQLAVACDLRVVAPHATFGIPSARLGVMLSEANIRRLVAVIGDPAARDVLLTARTIDAEGAARLGLVQRTAHDALAGACALADELAEFAPLSVEGHKRALNLVADTAHSPAEVSSAIDALETAAFTSRDFREGLQAFGEKRPPRFEGR
jgi:enoyl-CoA hydratase/carnithine racemase